MKQLLVSDFTPEDLAQLSRLDGVGFARNSALDLLEAVGSGELQAWRFGAGLLLTWREPPVLWVEGMTGTGLTLQSGKLMEETKELARSFACTTVRCVVDNPTLLKLYTKRLGYKPVGTILEATL
jgi:hypothetical protein